MFTEPECSSDDGPKCPYCGFVHSEAEDRTDHVSYWGSEDGPREFECHDCGLEFRVDEQVVRTWYSHPVIQPNCRD